MYPHLRVPVVGMRMYDIHAWVSASFFDDMVFSGPQNTDLLTEVRVFCMPIRELKRYCGQIPEKIVIYASAHSKVKTNLYE